MTSVEHGKLWDIGEAAEYLNVCRATVRTLSVVENRIPFMRVGKQLRFDPAKLRQWLDAQVRVTTDQTDRV